MDQRMTERERLTDLIETAVSIMQNTPEKLTDYLIERGVIIPPCKVGDTVFCEVGGFEVPLMGRVRNITMFDTCYSFMIAIPGYYAQCYTEKDFGHNIFLSRKEAEAALMERRKASVE